MDTLIILMVLFFVFLLLNVPIAIVILFISIIGIFFEGISQVIVTQHMINSISSETFLCVPLYIFAGILMSGSGVSQRIFDFALSLIGHVKGGLGYVNVLGSMIFAGVSGSATADAAGLGRIEIDAMNHAGYDIDFSAAVTAASSIIGPIIPPSIHFVIYATVAEVPVAALLIAGLVPGILMGLIMMLLIYVMIRMGKVKCPTQHDKFSFRRVIIKLKEGFWSIIAPGIIVGGIMSGIVTATEAGITAVLYTLIVGLFIYKTLNFKNILKSLEETLYSLGVVSFMVAVAKVFTWYITIKNVPRMFYEAVLSNTDSLVFLWLMTGILLFILGMFATASANIVLITPILLPLFNKFGVDPIHLGVVIVFGLVIGIITPPVGTSLYIVADVAKISFERVARSTMVFLIPLILCWLALMFIPSLSVFVPKYLGLY